MTYNDYSNQGFGGDTIPALQRAKSFCPLIKYKMKHFNQPPISVIPPADLIIFYRKNAQYRLPIHESIFAKMQYLNKNPIRTTHSVSF